MVPAINPPDQAFCMHKQQQKMDEALHSSLYHQSINRNQPMVHAKNGPSNYSNKLRSIKFHLVANNIDLSIHVTF